MADANWMNSQPPNPQRQAYRLAIAAKVHVVLWPLNETLAEGVIPPKSDLVSVAPHDLSPTGISVAMHGSNLAHLALRVTDRVGLLIDSFGARIVCSADVRYIKPFDDHLFRLGLAFNFDPVDLAHRRLAQQLEKVVASLGRDMLRRRAYYGTDTLEGA